MTERLYYRDATLRQFAARLTHVADGGRKVYLDRTAFYPTSGGQPHDVGLLAGTNVVDVIDEGERVGHVLRQPLADVSPGAELQGEIDWTRRFDHMQQHTGQHMVSAVIEELLGLKTVSVHFGPESSTLDVADDQGNANLLDAPAITEVERRANDIVAEARPVTVAFEEAASATGLRKQSDREGSLRIVTIEGIDKSACGGTHVATTAAIGAVLLRRQERVKQGLRIEFVCGTRAIARARRDLEALSAIARTYSASIDDVVRLVESQSAELREQQSELKRANEALARYRAAELHAGAAPDAHGVLVVVERSKSGVDSYRAVALAFSGLPGAMFVVVSHAPPSVLVATSADSGVDAGKMLKPLLERVQGRGGGSPRLAQGSAPSAGAVDQVVEWILNRVSPAPGV
jgi:alanyl-tRNA synthetase